MESTDTIANSASGEDSEETNIKDKSVPSDVVHNVEELGNIEEPKAQMESEMQTNAPDEINPYGYLDTDEFTTEIFKIEINHPKRFGTAQIKKRMFSLGLKPSKVKVIEKIKCAFVNFRCEEDREKALELLNGHQWMGKPMKVKKAKPSADPMLKKRKMEAESSGNSEGPGSKVVKMEGPIGERLNDAVTPLWRVSYEDQVQQKYKDMEEYFKRLGRTIQQNNTTMRSWLANQRKNCNGLCCHLHPVKTSPVLNGYRNKAEFTIGLSVEGKEKTVGFRLGQYRSGNLCVVEPQDCVNIPDVMKHMAKAVQSFLQEHSTYTGFDPETKSGHWHTLTLRHNRENHIMALLQFHPQKLTQEEIDTEERKLKEYVVSGAGATMVTELGLTEFYLNVKSDRSDGPTPQCATIVETQPFLERLLHLKFRISPDAFFQVNTLGAEMLYQTVGELCAATQDTTLLDVCCGTGTIGLTLAKVVNKVIGIEMCTEAVEDAKYNAALNNITNAEFHCGKAEDILPWLIHKLRDQEVIAVVDPPRAGLHVEVVKALRKAYFVKRLIYVSCKPTAALNNLTDFTRSESRRVRGPPFKVIEAVPVDLFPHTPHCELLMKLEREDQATKSAPDSTGPIDIGQGQAEGVHQGESDPTADGPSQMASGDSERPNECQEKKVDS